MFWKEVFLLIKKDLMIEWRKKYAINGLILYLISTTYISYASLKLRSADIEPITWNIIFWIIVLFTSIMTVSKSFSEERSGRLIYLYQLVSAESIIVSKIIYNFLILSILSILGFLVYSFFMGNPVQNNLIYVSTLLLASLGFASTLSLVAGIASKSDNSAMIMPVISFPVVIPLLLLIIKISKAAMDGLDPSESFDEIAILLAIDAIVVVLSVILYPYLWRS